MTSEDLMTKKITFSMAAKYLDVTKQALYVAYKKGKLNAEKVAGLWMTTMADLDVYISRKYDHTSLKMENGEPVYDREKGRYSIMDVAFLLGVSPQRIYYLLRKNAIAHFRRGSLYVITEHPSSLKKIVYSLDMRVTHAKK